MNRDKTAYPYVVHLSNGNDDCMTIHEPGLTRREVFAKAAMQGLISRPENDALKSTNDWFARQENVACAAVGYADALIAELDKEEGSHD